MTDAGSGSSHRCRLINGSSTTLIWQWPTPRYERREWWSLVGACVRKSRYGDGITVEWFLFLSSSFHLWISARYERRRHGFYHLRIWDNGRWSFPVHRIHRKVTLSGTDRLWDLWVCTIAYVERLFDCLLPFLSFPTLVWDYAVQEVCT